MYKTFELVGNQLVLPDHKRPPGRPRKPDALTPAERVAAYRCRRRKRGERDVRVWLPKDLYNELRRRAKKTGQPLDEIASNAIVRGMR